MLTQELAQFTGTERYYKHWLNFKYTDGVKYLAEHAHCFWLLDAIGSYQPKYRKIPFQLWTLEVNDKKAVLTMQEDSGMKNLVRQEIPFTDFPMQKIQMYLIDGILLLTI